MRSLLEGWENYISTYMLREWRENLGLKSRWVPRLSVTEKLYQWSKSSTTYIVNKQEVLVNMPKLSGTSNRCLQTPQKNTGIYSRIRFKEPPFQMILLEPARRDFMNQSKRYYCYTPLLPHLSRLSKNKIIKGPITGVYNVVNVRFVLEDGATHSVDSSSNAF